MSKCAFDKTRNCTDDCEWWTETDGPEIPHCLYLALANLNSTVLIEIKSGIEAISDTLAGINERL